MKAYFRYINARTGPDGKRGVYGRQIIWNYNDDQYTPPQAVQLTRRLVEQDKVFAIVGPLGTEVNPAIRPYLNSKKVPQTLVSTGASTGVRTEAVPVDDRLAARLPVRGQDLRPGDRRNSPNAKIAVLYQNDDYGKDYLTGLEAGLGEQDLATSSARSRSRSPRRAWRRRSRS